MMDEREILGAFRGPARLFPMPNMVMFPGVDQSLHIFEYRYRQLVSDSLSGDRLIALVLLRPDWEEDYDGEPAIEAVACLGLIEHCERFIDGRYTLRLRGLARFAIEEEIPAGDKLYRLASGRLIDPVAPNDLATLSALRKSLRAAVLGRFDASGAAFAQLSALFDGDSTLGGLCDRLAYSLPLALPVKQRLLEEPDVAVRVELLATALRLAPAPRPFPPPFSAN